MKRYSLILMLSVTALLAGCGGGGSSTSPSTVPSVNPPPPVVNQSPGGIWEGSLAVSYNGNVESTNQQAEVLVTEDGQFMGIVTDPTSGCEVLISGNLTVSGSNINGSATIGVADIGDVVQGCVLANGTTSGTASVTGTVSQRSSVSISVSDSDGGGTEIVKGTLTYNSLYSSGSSLASVNGNWLDPVGDILSINNGTLFEQDPETGCVINGTIGIINASYDAYSASFTYANCGGAASMLNGVTANGLALLDTTTSPAEILIGYTVAMNGGQVLVIDTLTQD